MLRIALPNTHSENENNRGVSLVSLGLTMRLIGSKLVFSFDLR